MSANDNAFIPKDSKVNEDSEANNNENSTNTVMRSPKLNPVVEHWEAIEKYFPDHSTTATTTIIADDAPAKIAEDQDPTASNLQSKSNLAEDSTGVLDDKKEQGELNPDSSSSTFIESSALNVVAKSMVGPELYTLYKYKEQQDRLNSQLEDIYERDELINVPIDEQMEGLENIAPFDNDEEEKIQLQEKQSLSDLQQQISEPPTSLGLQRVNSDPFPMLAAVANESSGITKNDPTVTTKEMNMSELLSPQGFRRDFVRKAEIKEFGHFNSQKRNKWTDSVFHFLALYGDELETMKKMNGEEDDSDSDEDDENEEQKEEKLLEKKKKHQKIQQPLNSNSKTMFLLIKSFVGAGVLYVPHAVSKAGLSLSIISILLVGLLSLHGMLLLIKTKVLLKTETTFAGIARASMHNIVYRPLGLDGNNKWLGNNQDT